MGDTCVNMQPGHKISNKQKQSHCRGFSFLIFKPNIFSMYTRRNSKQCCHYCLKRSSVYQSLYPTYSTTFFYGKYNNQIQCESLSQTQFSFSFEWMEQKILAGIWQLREIFGLETNQILRMTNVNCSTWYLFYFPNQLTNHLLYRFRHQQPNILTLYFK